MNSKKEEEHCGNAGPLVTRLMIVFVAMSLAACSGHRYRRDFDAAVRASRGTYEDVTGPWVGEWHSEASDHRGPLWCLVGPSERAPGQTDFRYRAKWAGVLAGSFKHTLPVEKRAKGMRVRGDADLGSLIGVYTIDAELGREAFDARYTSSKGDRGTMTLRRPGGAD